MNMLLYCILWTSSFDLFEQIIMNSKITWWHYIIVILLWISMLSLIENWFYVNVWNWRCDRRYVPIYLVSKKGNSFFVFVPLKHVWLLSLHLHQPSCKMVYQPDPGSYGGAGNDVVVLYMLNFGWFSWRLLKWCLLLNSFEVELFHSDISLQTEKNFNTWWQYELWYLDCNLQMYTFLSSHWFI